MRFTGDTFLGEFSDFKDALRLGGSDGNNFSYLKGHVSSQTFIFKGHIRKFVRH